MGIRIKMRRKKYPFFFFFFSCTLHATNIGPIGPFVIVLCGFVHY